MNHRISLLTIVVACVCGLVVANWSVNAQQPDPVEPRWEYTVFAFDAGDDAVNAAALFSRRLHQYASEGWQYEGKIAESSTRFDIDVNQSRIQTTTWVVFRRLVTR